MSPATAEEGGYRFIGSAPHKMKLHRINVKYLVILEKNSNIFAIASIVLPHRMSSLK